MNDGKKNLLLPDFNAAALPIFAGENQKPSLLSLIIACLRGLLGLLRIFPL